MPNIYIMGVGYVVRATATDKNRPDQHYGMNIDFRATLEKLGDASEQTLNACYDRVSLFRLILFLKDEAP